MLYVSRYGSWSDCKTYLHFQLKINLNVFNEILNVFVLLSL